MDELVVKVDGKDYKVFVEETEEGKILVHYGSEVYEVETKKDLEQSAIEKIRKKSSDESSSEIKAPLPGVVYEVKVKENESVKLGQPLIKLMAMKMENEIVAPRDCKIKEIKVKKDQSVGKDEVMILIE